MIKPRFTKGLLAAAAASVLLSGCSSLDLGRNLPSQKALVAQATDNWAASPAVTYAPGRTGIKVSAPNAIPAALRKKEVDLSMVTSATFGDLAALLKQMGVSLIVNPGAGSAAAPRPAKNAKKRAPAANAGGDWRKRPVGVLGYKGTLGGLIDAIADIHDMSVEYFPGGALVLGGAKPYAISLPQDQELVEAMEKELAALGATDVKGSPGAGVISYRATPAVQRLVGPVLDRLARNAAVIGMQLSIVTVSLDDSVKTGIDWAKVSAFAGDMALVGATPAAFAQAADAAFPPSSYDGAISRMVANTTGTGASFSENTAQLQIKRSRFSLSGFVQMLSNFGDAKTTQNLSLRTLSSLPVEFSSGEKIRYVSGVETQTTTNSQVVDKTQHQKLSTEEIGLSVKIIPGYDADAKLVTARLEFSLTNLIGWSEFKTATETITAPNTQEQKFSNVIRVPAGKTVVLGGLTYESLSNKQTSLPGLERSQLNSKTSDRRRNAMLIVLRPTVTLYGKAPKGKRK